MHAALPDLPRQHRGQRGARRHPGQPEGERDRPAVGRRRLRPHLRQHHAGLRDDRGRARPEEGHAGRGRGLLRRLGAVCARPERPDAHRGPRGDGPGRGGQRARHPVHAAPPVPGRPGQEPGRRHLGGDVRVRASGGAARFAVFAWWERRPPTPLLDLRSLRVPQFTTANITAFCTYFATFAIFFFTALYLVEVVNASGYRLALLFLPMTVLMILASVLAGRWTDATGPRWSITIGCALLAAGLVWTDGVLSPKPDYALLTVALALAGIRIRTTLVPITSSALSAAP